MSEEGREGRKEGRNSGLMRTYFKQNIWEGVRPNGVVHSCNKAFSSSYCSVLINPICISFSLSLSLSLSHSLPAVLLLLLLLLFYYYYSIFIFLFFFGGGSFPRAFSNRQQVESQNSYSPPFYTINFNSLIFLRFYLLPGYIIY